MDQTTINYFLTFIKDYMTFGIIMGCIMGAVLLIAGVALAIDLWKKHSKAYAFIAFILCFIFSATAFVLTTYAYHTVQNYLLK